MSDELHNRLVRAADDHGRPLPMQPTDLLATARIDRRRHRMRAAGASGALAIGAAAAVIAASAVVPSGDNGSNRGVAPAGLSGQNNVEPTVEPTQTGGGTPVDLGPLSEHEAQNVLERCARAYGGADRFSVVTARRVDGMWGPEGAVVAMDFGTRDVIGCSSDGSAGGYLAGEPPTGTQHPYNYSGGGGYRDCDNRATGRTITIEEGAWLSVSPQVQRVETRIGTDKRPGEWGVSWAHNGFAYVASWVEDLPVPRGATLSEMVRFFDADGNPLPADAPEEGTVLMSSEPISDDVPMIHLVDC